MLYFSRACILSIITGTQGVMQESKTYLSIVLVMIILVVIILVRIVGLHTNFDMSVFIAGHIMISIYTPCNQAVY